jgi:MFS family permease
MTLALLVLAEAAVAFSALAFEVIAARLVAPYAGMSTDTWTAIIAAFLLALALGNLAGGRIAARGNPGQGLRSAAIVCVLAAVAMLAVPLSIAAWDALILAPSPMSIWRLVVFASLPFVPAGFCLGVATPLLVTAALAAARHEGRAAGIMLAAGAAGSVAGVIAALWFLLDDFGVRASVNALAAVLTADAVLILALARTRATRAVVP